MSKVTKMKETPADVAERDRVFRASRDELLGYVERVERLAVQQAELKDDVAFVFAEAKSRGYDVPALKRIIKERKGDPEKLAQAREITDFYRELLS